MKRRQKSKMTMLIVGGLAAVSLVSVGFASWVIQGTNSANSDVNITVGTVDNKSLTATILNAGKNLDLCFDNVEHPSGDILSTVTQEKYEDLTFVIPVKIAGNLSLLNTIRFTFTGTLVDASLYGTESTEYLIAPWISDNSEKAVIYTYSSNSLNPVDKTRVSASAPDTSTTGEVTITFTFNFKWGKAFNNENPGNVSDAEIQKQTLIDRLNAFKKAMPVSPTLHVVVAPTTTAA